MSSASWDGVIFPLFGLLGTYSTFTYLSVVFFVFVFSLPAIPFINEACVLRGNLLFWLQREAFCGHESG